MAGEERTRLFSNFLLNDSPSALIYRRLITKAYKTAYLPSQLTEENDAEVRKIGFSIRTFSLFCSAINYPGEGDALLLSVFVEKAVDLGIVRATRFNVCVVPFSREKHTSLMAALFLAQ